MRRRVRAAIRRFVKAAIDSVPLRVLEQVRADYFAGSQSPIGGSVRRATLDLMRLRELTHIDTFSVPDARDVKFVAANSYAVHRLYWLGTLGYEPGEIGWWVALVRSHEKVLELGANVGVYTVFGARASKATAYKAVEPNPESADLLRRNLSLNGLGHVTVVEAAAVGSRGPATTALHIPDGERYGAQSGSYISSAQEMSDRPSSRSVTVPVVPTNSLIAGVDLIKLDIEGMELEVLQSVHPWLLETGPTLLVELRGSAIRLRNYVSELAEDGGYECYVATRRGALRIAPARLRDTELLRAFGSRDVTLLRPDRSRRVDFDLDLAIKSLSAR